MPEPNLRLSAAEAQRMAGDFVRGMNQSRKMPTVPASIERIATEETVHVFNVGPFPHEIPLGSVGTFFIPACEKGKPFAAMRPLPGICTEPYPVDEKHMGLFHEEGRYIAEQIIGIGKHRPPADSLLKYGVFIAEGKSPTKVELETARTRLTEYYQELVADARAAYAQGQKEAEAVIRPQLHFLAARELNLTDEPWMVNTNPAARQTCPACGTACNAGIVLCPNCKFVLDEKKYATMKDRFAQ